MKKISVLVIYILSIVALIPNALLVAGKVETAIRIKNRMNGGEAGESFGFLVMFLTYAWLLALIPIISAILVLKHNWTYLNNINKIIPALILVFASLPIVLFVYLSPWIHSKILPQTPWNLEMTAPSNSDRINLTKNRQSEQ